MDPTAALRTATWLAFFAAILASWLVIYAMAVDMGLDLAGRPAGAGLPFPDAGPAPMRMDGFAPLFAMWSVMMAAMMLPTMAPALATYERLIASADGTRAGLLGLLAGYLGAWVAFAALLSAAQVALLSAGAVDMLGAASSPWTAALLLLAAGGYQFTRAKEICHGVCLAPMRYFLGHWRTGVAGGLAMGAGLGRFCVGCCWAIMALGFAGGVMNFLWMGLATLFMVMEKLPAVGQRLRRPAGIALILGAAWAAAAG